MNISFDHVSLDNFLIETDDPRLVNEGDNDSITHDYISTKKSGEEAFNVIGDKTR